MLIPASKLTADRLDYVVSFTFANKSSMNQAFPNCNSETALAETLRTSGDRWNVLVLENPLALFTLRISGATAAVDNFLCESTESIGTAISSLRQHLAQRKVEELVVNVPEDLETALGENGFEEHATLLRFSAIVVETKLMPILPLTNPSDRDVPALARLMQESYAKTKGKSPSDASNIERTLRGIISGHHGTFLSEASFISKASDKLVSACLITANDNGAADVAELFTHPLYRARGLATTEIAMSMNRLRKAGYSILRVLLKEDDAFVRRLFEKVGFKKDVRIVQMATKIR